jgi:hypothetical protein
VATVNLVVPAFVIMEAKIPPSAAGSVLCGLLSLSTTVAASGADTPLGSRYGPTVAFTALPVLGSSHR